MSPLLDDDLETIEYVDPSARRERRRNDRQLHKPRMDKWAVRASVQGNGHAPAFDELRLDAALDATREEKAYLIEQLSLFAASKPPLITSVLRRVKGGKEANVYCCAAPAGSSHELIAAKVYRPRQFRNLKNDSQYRQGRALLNPNGEVIDLRHDWRMKKAIEQKSRKGLEVTQGSWVAYEFQTMLRLYRAGADVPQPFRNSEHAILMEYFGEVGLAAPTLHLVALPPDEARPLFERLMDNVQLMLNQHVIHGDLSAYNVLYWEGEVRIIDLPQTVDPRANPDARAIFFRDVERLCQYFARFGVRSNPRAIAHHLWRQYQAANRPVEADLLPE
jgi:RIO kinase 1